MPSASKAAASTDRRMLLVHAHPDDECSSTGATMAKYAAEGTGVTLLICTLGELGEVLVPELAQLAADQADQLGGYRMGELRAALDILGVADQRYLGGPGRFRDSGMIGTEGNTAPRAFWRASEDPAVFDAAVAAAVEVIRDVRPQVLITYDTNGGYGHPDHIMAHRVAMAAADKAGDADFVTDAEAWVIRKIYWAVLPKSWLWEGVMAMRAAGVEGFFGEEITGPEDIQMGTDDELVTTRIDATPFAAAKADALRAHATQITADGPFFKMIEVLGLEGWGVEFFQLVRGEAVREGSEYETDLFAGLAV